MSEPTVVYCVPDKMGGMLNIVAHLLEYRRPDGFRHEAVLVDNPLSDDARFGGRMACDRQVTVPFTLPRENLYAALRRLARAIPAGPGVLVSNDWLELAMLYRHDPGKAVIQILHGDHDYYYDLACKHEPVIDAYVCYSRKMYDTLRELLPRRAETIFHLPYGIPLPARVREGRPGPLRLIFAGRFEHGQKGVFDLPEIDRELQRRGVEITWTLVGAGPDEAELRRRWGAQPHVAWLGLKSTPEVVALHAEHDLFVLPTRAEGFPVALLEAMGAGLVPVVSDIPSGVPEIVDAGVTGELPPVGDVAAFAAAISGLDADRDRLEAMSAAARTRVAERYDVRDRVADYQALYARWRDLYRPKPRGGRPPYGSRLDQPWIPNLAVRALRGLRRRLAS
jgi:glycosyltransferase involved in cell wall biosynthesis